MSGINCLKAVFWDYPELVNDEYLKKILEEGNDEIRDWILTRFMEHGRVVDTLRFFSLKIISERISRLRLTPYTKKKWSRILEVYGKDY